MRRVGARARRGGVCLAAALVGVLTAGGVVSTGTPGAAAVRPAVTPTPTPTATGSANGSAGPADVNGPALPGADTAGNTNDQGADTADGRRAYGGSPEAEAQLVADEDRRLIDIRVLRAINRWSKRPVTTPYRVASGSTYTLILTERKAPYTIGEVMRLAPQTFVRMPDGGLLLSEHLVVRPGATLSLRSSTPVTLRLASDARSFASIVSDGGRLEIGGTATSPLTIESWDREAGTTDRRTNDGRAYVRAIGGQVVIDHARFRQLGFWSGRTGGVALTGTDRPNTGALDASGNSIPLGAIDPSPPTRAQERAERRASRDASRAASPTGPAASGGVATARRTPSAPVVPPPLPAPKVDVGTFSYVAASVRNTTFTGNAYGLFVANANGLDVRSVVAQSSLVDGIVLHRYVSNAALTSVSARDSGGDGIVISRATSGVVVTKSTAVGNSRNGFTLSGLPLADGPSPVGTAVRAHGNNTLTGCSATDNGRYGVEVIGGQRIRVNHSTTSGSDMGIVAREGATEVILDDNSVTGARRHGIAVRDSVTAATLTGNNVVGGATGIYVRDSSAQIARNTLAGASDHGLTLVGSTSGVIAVDNTITGRGPSAVDTFRAVGVRRDALSNNTAGWVDTTPWLVTLRRAAQPLTVLWLLLGLLVLVTAVRGRRRPMLRKEHPYAATRPLRAPGNDHARPA